MPCASPRHIAQTLRIKLGRRRRAGVENTKRTMLAGIRNDEKTVTISSDFKPGIRATTGTDSRPHGTLSAAAVDMIGTGSGPHLHPTLTYESICLRRLGSRSRRHRDCKWDPWVIIP